MTGKNPPEAPIPDIPEIIEEILKVEVTNQEKPEKQSHYTDTVDTEGINIEIPSEEEIKEYQEDITNA